MTPSPSGGVVGEGREGWLLDRLGEHAIPNGMHDRANAGLQAASTDEKARPYVVGEIVCQEWASDGGLWPVGLLVVQGRQAAYHDLRGIATPTSDALARCFESIPRGAVVLVRDGARQGFHVFLRHLGIPLAQAGWEVYPLAAGSGIRGLNIKRGKQSVWLADLEAATGWSPEQTERAIADRGGPERAEQGSLERLYYAVGRLQAVLLSTFGVGLKPTVGALATKAVRRSLPKGYIWWKPQPLLAAACSWGGAYRGGYSRAERYSGPAWKVDLTRAYTWALSLPLPARAALCRCDEGEEVGPGVYLCRVRGHSELPVYLPTWQADLGQFRKQYRRDYSGLAFLPEVEVVALRGMGYEVTPLWGWRFVQQLTLRSFTDRLAGLQAAYGRGSPESSTAKAMANSFYGRLAQNPNREDVCYAADRPGEGWWPFITPEREIVPYLWAKPSRSHEPYHHIDAAAVVTARVRARSMTWVGDYVSRGGRVIYWDTDGGLVHPLPPAIYLDSADVPGAMLERGYDEHAMVLGAKRYIWADELHAAGVGDVGAADLAMVREGKRVVVARHLMGRPWLTGEQHQTSPYTIA